MCSKKIMLELIIIEIGTFVKNINEKRKESDCLKK